MLIIYLNMLETSDDKDKIAQIYDRYKGLVFHIAYEFLKNEQDSQDATHDTFLRIIKNIDKIEDVASYKTKSFVVIIVESVCKDFLKRKNIIKFTSYDDIEYQQKGKNITENSIIEDEEVNYLYKKIGELDIIYQQVIILHYAKELSYSEISAILGLKTTTVRKRVERAKKLLEKKLNEKND